MSRIKKLMAKKTNILNVFLTAGFPRLNDTIEIVQELEKNGVDMIEIGMPFSDPLADGPTIQNSSEIAIQNGITLSQILQQIKTIRETVKIPIVLMGYYNQILQFGSLSFFQQAKEAGVDGFIIPDLPLDVFSQEHKKVFQSLELDMIFLITPQTSEERIRMIDSESSGFVYLVSSFAITGSQNEISEKQKKYFNRINAMKLSNPTLIGFGISSKKSFNEACKYSHGAIIGSAFIKSLKEGNNIKNTVSHFINKII